VTGLQQSRSNISLNRSNSKLGGTSALLLWVQKRVMHVEVPTGWKTGWQDGLVLCSLAINFWPDCIDFNSLSQEDTPEMRLKNCEIAMDVFEKHGIPSLMDPEDLSSVAYVEPRSLQTYVSEIRKRLEPKAGEGASPALSTRKNADIASIPGSL
jgi:hypothetical protein